VISGVDLSLQYFFPLDDIDVHYCAQSRVETASTRSARRSRCIYLVLHFTTTYMYLRVFSILSRIPDTTHVHLPNLVIVHSGEGFHGKTDDSRGPCERPRIKTRSLFAAALGGFKSRDLGAVCSIDCLRTCPPVRCPKVTSDSHMHDHWPKDLHNASGLTTGISATRPAIGKSLGNHAWPWNTSTSNNVLERNTVNYAWSQYLRLCLAFPSSLHSV
jgi:hypothetical protein